MIELKFNNRDSVFITAEMGDDIYRQVLGGSGAYNVKGVDCEGNHIETTLRINDLR